jgi:hypothetical protein
VCGLANSLITAVRNPAGGTALRCWPSSTFDAAHVFVTHAKADPRNGIPRLTMGTVFEVAVDAKIYRVSGKALQTVDSILCCVTESLPDNVRSAAG